MTKKLRKGDIIQHFKGEQYKVLVVGVHTQTKKRYIVAQNLDDLGHMVEIIPVNSLWNTIKYQGVRVRRYKFLRREKTLS